VYFGEQDSPFLYTLGFDEIAARGIETLPQSLKEAVDALKADPLFKDNMGVEIVDEFIEQKIIYYKS
jgi:glutamine synthetase